MTSPGYNCRVLTGGPRDRSMSPDGKLKVPGLEWALKEGGGLGKFSWEKCADCELLEWAVGSYRRCSSRLVTWCEARFREVR